MSFNFSNVRGRASVVGMTVALLMVGLTCAQATIVDHGSYLTDTTTSLDWLDLTATQGLSYNSVLGSMPAGGWGYASVANVDQLFTDAGGIGPYNFTPPNGLATSEGAATSLLMSLMGNTVPLGLPGGAGLTSTTNGSNHVVAYYLNLPPTTDYLLDSFGLQGPNSTDPTVGSFLIRATVAQVPEPLTMSLFGAGLAGAVAMRRRKKAQTA